VRFESSRFRPWRANRAGTRRGFESRRHVRVCGSTPLLSSLEDESIKDRACLESSARRASGVRCESSGFRPGS